MSSPLVIMPISSAPRRVPPTPPTPPERLVPPMTTDAMASSSYIIPALGWPVVLRAAEYRRWAETLEELTAQLSPAAQRKLWAENAARFYRL